MATCRLIVNLEGRLLGHFEADGPHALNDIDLIASNFQKIPGFELELLVAQGERRILETGPDSIRVLSAEPIFKPDKSWPDRRKDLKPSL